MVSIYSIRKNTLAQNSLLQVELRGLSTDNKPTSFDNGLVDNGSVFIEIDTGDVYLYNMEDEEWEPVVEAEPIEVNEDDNKKIVIEDLQEEK